MKLTQRIAEFPTYLLKVWHPRHLARIQREIDFSVEHCLNAGTRHDTLLGLRDRMCKYAPRNGGAGRKPGDPRHFEDYVEDVLGEEWDDDAAAAFQREQWMGVAEVR